MGIPTDRISGLFFVGLGILLYFFLIPKNVEMVDYGWVRPNTLPKALAVVIVVSGIWQIVSPVDELKSDPGTMTWATVNLLIVAVGIALISKFGFVLVSPFLAATIMLVMGERRVGWLSLGIVGIPFLIWLVVVVLLGRLLP